MFYILEGEWLFFAMRPARGLSKTNCSRTSKWQSMITHCKESKWLPMEWIGGQRIMAEHRWKIDVWLGVITPLGGSLLIYPTNGKCFYSNEGVWRAKMTATGQRGAPPSAAATLLPNHNTHTIKCLLMDKCTLRRRSLRSIPQATPVASKCADRCIDEKKNQKAITALTY